ncbi:MAG: TonB-dependent receptor plug domain-containing protein, partial [Pseudomonadota bacterium]|nr:TonB-dependent receptor plug domain-containing protein [Pseudomonadota bacterium]
MWDAFRLALGSALCAVVPIATAQETTGVLGDDSLSAVVVVANRAPEPVGKTGSSVTVLTGAAIKESQETVVADLLARTPGITVARNGGVGQATSVFIRGADSDQTVVLIDGVQLNDPSTTAGGFNFANLLTAGVSRIELLRGAQSTLYGSQAIGGVVNIITSDLADPRTAHLAAEGGSHGTGLWTGDAGGQTEALQWRLSGNWYGTSGIDSFDQRYGGRRPNASQIGGATGTLRYAVTPQLQLDLRSYYTQSRTDFDGYDTPTGAFGDDQEYGKTRQFVGY